ncbi:hypothetical protein F7725_023588 [Dissostichus mawsoni]|uniref:Uncharacterized protein n=1 Tax=Dissostichus mawsoni TaxID=36200 RepID=A0A7J5XYN8_DISMA|nr:hypothetical protein F7725_023588 [Dissostichus mawsoni]
MRCVHGRGERVRQVMRKRNSSEDRGTTGSLLDSDPDLKQRPDREAPEPAERAPQGPGGDGETVQEVGIGAKLKRLMFWLLVIYVSIPFIVKLCPSIQAKIVFLNFETPGPGLNHTQTSTCSRRAGSTSESEEETTGSSCTRSSAPRVPCAHLRLQSGGWTPNAALHLGHSLGTGVATNLVRRLCERGSPPDALILESPFTNIREEARSHPFSMVYRYLPGFDWFFLDAITANNIHFASDENDFLGHQQTDDSAENTHS